MKNLFLIIILIFTGCGSNSLQTFNRSDIYWTKNILKAIDKGNLDAADDYYVSLTSEHIASIYLKPITLQLAKTHYDKNQHLMAIFYYDQYIDKFASKDEIQMIKFLKIKTRYKKISHISKSEVSLQNAITEIRNFFSIYSNSPYKVEINTMLENLLIAQSLSNKKIASLYKKLGHTKAYELYKEKIINLDEYELPKSPWYKKIFQ